MLLKISSNEGFLETLKEEIFPRDTAWPGTGGIPRQFIRERYKQEIAGPSSPAAATRPITGDFRQRPSQTKMLDISAIVLSHRDPSLQLLIDKTFLWQDGWPQYCVGTGVKSLACDSWPVETRRGHIRADKDLIQGCWCHPVTPVNLWRGET